MQFVKTVFNFYINSSIHVALSVYALTWISLKQFDLAYDESVLYFNFFASITGYNFVKYFGVAKWHHRRLAHWLKIIQIFSLACFLIFIFYALRLEIKTLFFVGAFAAVTFLYAIPFIPKKIYLDAQQNLREISGLKIYIIAIVWAGVTVFLPLINAELSFSSDVFITAFQRFLFVFVLMLPFEIRDLQFDSIKLATIPQKIGVKRTKILGILLLVVFFLLESFKDETTNVNILASVIVMLITMLFLAFSKKDRHFYFTAFWVETIPVIWLLLLLFL